MNPPHGRAAVLLFFLHQCFLTTTAEECPHFDIVTLNGTINALRCAIVSDCPGHKFQENCVLDCHFGSLTGKVKCERVNGTLITSDPKGILTRYLPTTATPSTISPSTTPSPSTASDIPSSSPKVTYWPVTEAHTSITPAPSTQLSRTHLILILGVCFGALIVATLVGGSMALWWRNRKTKVLPITPSKPRTKPNEPI